MRIDLPLKETWDAVSEQYRAALPGLSPATQVQIYAGYQHALFEATVGLGRLFSHKRSIATVEPAEPVAAAIEAAFAGEGYNIRHLRDLSSLNASSAADEALLQNATELAFVVFSDDDPVTGRVFDHSRLLGELKDQRIFRIHLSHAAHRFAPGIPQPAPYEIRICSLSPERALLVAGERFKIQPALAPRLPWHAAASVDERLAVISPERYQVQKKTILDFEDSLPEGFRSYFDAKDQQRVFDRAVIVADEVDGFALIDELARALGVALAVAPGVDGQLETSSPCRWNDLRYTDWLLARGEKETTIRGLIVIDPALLKPELPSALVTAARTLKALQG